MAQLLVQDVDDAAIETLRKKAQAQGRTLEDQVRLILEEEAKRLQGAETFWERADAIRASLGPDPTNSAELRKIGRRGE